MPNIKVSRTDAHIVIVTTNGGDWGGLYVDGVLDRFGHEYSLTERVLQILAVEEVTDDAVMTGTDSREVWPTLAEVETHSLVLKQRTADAAKRREQAARLIREAEQLERNQS